MISTTAAIIGSAVVGAGASAYSASKQADAAKKAGQQQQQATDQTLALQREQMARSFEILSKYGAQGDWARNQMAAFMGAPQMTSTATRGNAAGPATPDWQRYYDEQLSNPNLGQASNWEKNAKLRALYNNDKLAFAEDHYRKNGNGAPLPMTGGDAAPGGMDDLKTPDQLREDAMANYEASPWAQIAATAADDATKEFTSMAGAQGSALAGRTARGMAEVANREKQKGFGSYYSALNDMADTGFVADTGIVSGGQTFADRSGSALINNAGAAGDAAKGEADAWSSALTDAAGWAGWAAGNIWDPAGKGGTNTSQTTYKSPTTSGRSTTGGLGRIQ